MKWLSGLEDSWTEQHFLDLIFTLTEAQWRWAAMSRPAIRGLASTGSMKRHALPPARQRCSNHLRDGRSHEQNVPESTHVLHLSNTAVYCIQNTTIQMRNVISNCFRKAFIDIGQNATMAFDLVDFIKLRLMYGLPWWFSGQDAGSQCRVLAFDPWSED